MNPKLYFVLFCFQMRVWQGAVPALLYESYVLFCFVLFSDAGVAGCCPGTSI